MVHIYHGDGKGKTTAAMGIALRMLGNGKRVFIVQYLKGKPSGEILALLKMEGVTVLRGRPDTKFVFQMTENELLAVAALHTRQLDLAVAAAKDGKAELI
ncbi:MAG: cob(I)yrinic acid a,c-diamide adenosyltransferase, partial [Clostridia bacterium]|nr:cob(I)yrinic acid a,c-diamide adenosyltransferase [Clostridia bacterium]